MKFEWFNILDYLYYRMTLFYRENESSSGEYGNRYTAAIYVSLVVILNSISLLLLVFSSIFEREYLIEVLYCSICDVLLYVIPAFIVVLCIYMYAHVRHERIFNRYSKQTIDQKKIRDRVALLFFVFSFLSVMAVIVGLGGKL